MIGLTKEELEELIWLAHNIPYRMSDYPIYKKIQSIIDNYCEYEEEYMKRNIMYHFL